jgi:hypothetical protein
MFTNKTHVATKTDGGVMPERNKRIFNFLHDNPVGVLSSVTRDGNPHGAVIYFKTEEDFTISLLIKSLTRKYDNITHNNHVMLTVYEPKTQTTVQVTGVAHERKDTHANNDLAVAIIKASLKMSGTDILPVAKLRAGQYVVLAIVPVQIRMAVYARSGSGGYEDMFESIESFDLHDEYL